MTPYRRNLIELFRKFTTELDYVQDIAKKKTAKAINEILKASNNDYDEFIFSKLIIKFLEQGLNQDEIIKIIKNYNPSLDRFFRLVTLRENDDLINNIDKLN